MPKALVVRFTLKPEAAEGFDKLVAATVAKIHTEEPGTWVYAVHQVAEHPDERIFYELYKDDEAFRDHESQPHTRRFLSERGQYLSSVSVDFCTPLVAAGIPALDGTDT